MTRAPSHILILGGSRDARVLASLLAPAVAAGNLNVTYSLAGRTRAPLPLPAGIRVRSGGFGGVEGLAAFLLREHIARMVDATHPFARQMATHAAAAAAATGVRLVKLIRQPLAPGSRWLVLPAIADAAAALPTGAAAFLALGAEGGRSFAGRPDLDLVLRVAEAPEAGVPPLLPFPHRLVIGLPEVREIAAETAMLAAAFAPHRQCRHYLVLRNTGGADMAATAAAADALRLPVLAIAPPPLPQGAPCVADPAQAAAFAMATPS